MCIQGDLRLPYCRSWAGPVLHITGSPALSASEIMTINVLTGKTLRPTHAGTHATALSGRWSKVGGSSADD
jgi:hypothetical protein